MEILRTRYKEKTPKGFSYPIGAEKISEALFDAIDGDKCVIYFSVRDDFWASSFNQRIKDQLPLRIFQLRYSQPQTNLSSSQSMIDSGWYDPKWKIEVNAVPTKYASSAKSLLINELSEASLWLTSPKAKKQSWQRFYDLKNDILLQDI
jgi:hypothetical protein